MDFSLDVVGSRAQITLGQRPLGGGFELTQLALEIPDLSFPFDLSGGLGRFRPRRCQLRRLGARVPTPVLEEQLRAAPVARYGFRELGCRWSAGTLGVVGIMALGERRVPFSLRLRLLGAEDQFRPWVVVDRWRWYGYLPVPTPLLSVGLLTALGARTACAEAPRPALELLGASHARLDPVALLLRPLLPAFGWRLPAVTDVGLQSVSLEAEQLTLQWTALGERTQPPARGAQARLVGGDEATDEDRELVAALTRYAQGETLLARGQTSEALVYYDEQAAAAPEDPFVLGRRLELLASAPSTIQQARRLAARVGAGQPAHTVALHVLATTAEELGDGAEAVSRYARLAELAEQGGRRAEALAATLACGRLLEAEQPELAVSWFERALGLAPHDRQAMEALAGLYQQQGRAAEHVALQRRYVAQLTGEQERFVVRLALGRYLLEQAGDAAAARDEFERALGLRPRDHAAWEGLAEARERLGEPGPASAAWARIAELAEADGASALAHRARRRSAALLADQGDLDAALAATTALLTGEGVDAPLLELHAALCLRVERWEEAAEVLQRVLERPDVEARRPVIALELARVRLQHLADPAGAWHALQPALGPEATSAALGLGVEASGAAARWAEQAGLLARLAADAPDPETAATWRLQRAALLHERLGQGAQALGELSALREELPRAAGAALRLAVVLQAGAPPAERRETLEALAALVLAEQRVDVAGDLEAFMTLGELLCAAGEFGAAKRHLRRLHAALPDEPRPVMALAELLSAPEEQPERESLLERLVHLSVGAGDEGRQATALRELGELRRDQGRHEEALVALRAAENLAPGDLVVRYLKAESAFALGAWTEAEESFGGLVDTPHPASVAPGLVSLRLGQLAARRHEHDRAEQAFRHALAAPAAGLVAAQAHAGLRGVLLAARRWAEAAEALQTAAEDIAAALDERARVQALHEAATLRWRRLGEPEVARTLFGRLLALRPDHRESLLAAIELASAAGDWTEVASLLERRVDLATDTAERVGLLAEVAEVQAIWLAEPAASRRSYERLLDLAPDHRGALHAVAADALRQGEAAVAESCFSRLLELGPDAGVGEERGRGERLVVHRALAELAGQTGDEDAQRVQLQCVLELEPDDPAALLGLDALYERQGAWAQLLPLLKRRALQAADAGQALRHWWRLARLAEGELDQPAEAMEAYRQILRVEPGHQDALLGLVELQGRTGAPAVERRPILERLLKLSAGTQRVAGVRSRAALQFELGWLLRQELGEPGEGARLLTEAFEGGYRDDRLLLELVGIAQETGEQPALRGALEQLVLHGQDPAQLVVARCELARLHLDQGGVATARRLLDEIVADAHTDRSLQLLAAVHRALGDWEAAYAALWRVVQRASEGEQPGAALPLLDELLALAAGPLADDARLMDAAELTLAIDPAHAAGREALLLAARRQRDPVRLQSALEGQLAAAQSLGEPVSRQVALVLELGRLAWGLPGGLERAAAQAAVAVRLDPRSAEAQLFGAEVAAAREDWGACQATLEALARELLADAPDAAQRGLAAEVLLQQAEIYRRVLQRPARARQAWRAASAVLEGEALLQVLERWAQQARREGIWSEVAEVAERIWVLRGGLGDAFRLTEAYERLGRVDDALRVLGEAPTEGDGGPEADEQLLALRRLQRRLLAESGRFAELARALEHEAREARDPERQAAMLRDAAAHYLDRAGDQERGESCLLQVLEANPRDAEALERLLARAPSPRHAARVGELFSRLAGEALVDGEGEKAAGAPTPAGQQLERSALLARLAAFWLGWPAAPDQGRAQQWLRRAVELDPGRVVDLQRHAEYLEAEGDERALVDWLAWGEGHAALTPTERLVLVRWRARLLATRLGDPEAGLGLLDASVDGADERSQLELLQTKASLLEQLGREAEAEAVLAELADRSEEPAPALERALALASARGDEAASVGYLWRLVEVLPAGDRLVARLEALVTRCGSTGDRGGEITALGHLADLAEGPAEQVRYLLALGRAEARRHGWEAAQGHLEQAAHLHPEAFEVQRELATAATHNRDARVARVALATAHELLEPQAAEERAALSMERSQLERAVAGDLALARRYARQAAEETRLPEQRARALRAVAELARSAGDAEQEEAALRDLHALGVADVPELERLAALYEQRAAWEAARELYVHLGQSRPDDPTLLRRQAAAFRGIGAPLRAAEMLQLAAGRWEALGEPARAAAELREAAELRVAVGETVEALGLLERALGLTPGDEALFRRFEARCQDAGEVETLLRGWELRMPALAPAVRREAWAEMADLARERLGDHARAVSYWKAGLDTGADDPRLLSALIMHFAAERDWAQVWEYGMRLEAVGGPPEEQAFSVHRHLAAAASQREERGRARAHLHGALAMEPESVEVGAELERLLVEDGEVDELLELLLDRAQWQSGQARARTLARAGALCVEALGRPAEAILLLEEALAADPDAEETRRRLLDLLRSAERWDDLYRQLQVALRRARGVEAAELADELADLALHRLGDAAAAQRYRRSALLAAPGDVGRLRALVDLLANQRLWEALVELLAEALDTVVLDRESAAGFYALLARTYLEKLEQPEQAQKVFERARARHALTPRSAELLAELYEAAGAFENLAELLGEIAAFPGDEQVRRRVQVKRARVLADHLGRPGEAAEVLFELFREAPGQRQKLGLMARELFARDLRFADALRVLDEQLAVAEGEEAVPLHLGRAELFERQLGQAARARDDYAAVLALAPELVTARLGLARVQLALGELEGAGREAESVLRLGQEVEQSAARVIRGKIALEQERISDALVELELALQLTPEDTALVALLDRTYTAHGEWSRLAELLGRRIAQASSGAERARAWYRRALLYRDMLEHGADALRCFKEAVAADPQHAEAVVALRAHAETVGDWETALAILDQELSNARSPEERARVQRRRADLLEQQLGQVEAAIEALEAARELEGDSDPQLRRRLARLYVDAQRWRRAGVLTRGLADASNDPRERCADWLQAAALFELGEAWDQARRLYREVLSASEDSDALTALSHLDALATSESEQVALLEVAERRLAGLPPGPLASRLLKLLVQLADMVGDADRAERHAEALFAADPEDGVAFQHRRRRLGREEDWSALVALIERRLPLTDALERGELLWQLVRLQWVELQDAAATVAALDSLLSVVPRHAEALRLRLTYAEDAGELDRAAELLERLVELADEHERAALALRRGRLSQAQGLLEQAVAQFEQASAGDAERPEALQALHNLYRELGQPREAATALERLVAALPDDGRDALVAAGLRLAELRVEWGSWAEAAAGLEALASRVPEAPEVLQRLEEVYHTTSQWLELVATLERLAQRQGDPAVQADLQVRIGELRRLRLGDEVSARACYEQAVALAPFHPLANLRLAAGHARRGQWDALERCAVAALGANALPAREIEAEARLARSLARVLQQDTPAEVLADASAAVGPADALAPANAMGLLGDVATGLGSLEGGYGVLGALLELLEPGWGRDRLSNWALAGERLIQAAPGAQPLHHLLGPLNERLGRQRAAAAHQVVLRFLEGLAPIRRRSAEEQSERAAEWLLGPDSPALPEAAGGALRVLLPLVREDLWRWLPPEAPADPGKPLAVRGLGTSVEALRALLQVGPLAAVTLRRVAAPVVCVPAEQPWLLIDERMTRWPPAQVQFLLARALELLRSGAVLLESPWPVEPDALLATLAAALEVPLPAGSASDETLAATLAAAGCGPAALPPPRLAALRAAFEAYYRDPQPLAAYAATARQAANRIGLLAVADLEAALWGLARQLRAEWRIPAGATPAVVAHARLLEESSEVADLIAFGTSARYHELLRRRADSGPD